MSGPNLNFLFASVHPQFMTDLFQTFRVCLVQRVVQHISVFYIADLRLAGGYDLVMLSLWDNIQIAPLPKIIDISALFHHFCASIPPYVTIRD